MSARYRREGNRQTALLGASAATTKFARGASASGFAVGVKMKDVKIQEVRRRRRKSLNVPRHTKAEDAAPERGVVPEAGRRAEEPRIAAP